jgi:hypothetical protein
VKNREHEDIVVLCLGTAILLFLLLDLYGAFA